MAAPSVIVGEIDGIRMLTNNSCEFIHRVSGKLLVIMLVDMLLCNLKTRYMYFVSKSVLPNGRDLALNSWDMFL